MFRPGSTAQITSGSRFQIDLNDEAGANHPASSSGTLAQNPSPLDHFVPRGRIRYVITNWTEGSSRADNSSTQSPTSSRPSYRRSAPRPTLAGQVNFPALRRRRASNNLRPRPLDSVPTSTPEPEESRTTDIAAASPQPLQGEEEPSLDLNATQPTLSSDSIQCEGMAKVPAKVKILKHEARPSVPSEVNARIFAPVKTGNAEEAAPQLSPIARPPSSRHLSPGTSSADTFQGWRRRQPDDGVAPHIAIGGHNALPDPFTDGQPTPAQQPQAPQAHALAQLGALLDAPGAATVENAVEFSTTRPWDDFSSDEFPSAGNAREVVQVGPEQWELRPKEYRLGTPPLRPGRNDILNHPRLRAFLAPPCEPGTGWSQSTDKVQRAPGATPRPNSIPPPNPMGSDRYMLVGLAPGVAVKNARLGIAGLQQALERITDNFDALANNNEALTNNAAVDGHRRERVEQELTLAWAALRERDLEIDRLRGIIVHANRALRTALPRNQGEGDQTEDADEMYFPPFAYYAPPLPPNWPAQQPPTQVRNPPEQNIAVAIQRWIDEPPTTQSHESRDPNQHGHGDDFGGSGRQQPTLNSHDDTRQTVQPDSSVSNRPGACSEPRNPFRHPPLSGTEDALQQQPPVGSQTAPANLFQPGIEYQPLSQRHSTSTIEPWEADLEHVGEVEAEDLYGGDEDEGHSSTENSGESPPEDEEGGKGPSTMHVENAGDASETVTTLHHDGDGSSPSDLPPCMLRQDTESAGEDEDDWEDIDNDDDQDRGDDGSAISQPESGGALKVTPAIAR